MKLVAVATIYDEHFTFTRELPVREDLTDEEIIQFMADAEGTETPLDSVVLITFDGGDVFTSELIDG